MASYNVARYYDMTDLHGVIATGRYATLNFLEDEYESSTDGCIIERNLVET